MMKANSIAEALVRIASSCEIEHFMPGDNREPPFRAFGFGPDALVVRGEDNSKAFNSGVEELYNSSPDLTHAITVDEFESRLVTVISTCKKAKFLPTADTARDLIAGILKEPCKDWTVVRPLYGASIGSLPELKLGSFTLFPYKSIHTYIKTINTNWTQVNGDFFQDCPLLCISCTIDSSTGNRAQELASIIFEKFELIIAYMLGTRDSRYSVAVLNIRHRHVEKSMAIASDSMSMLSLRIGPHQDVDLSDYYFRSSDTGHERLWQLISQRTHNEMEKRLLNSIEWTGRAILDDDDAKAIIQSMLAVESLLQVDQRDIVKPSIGSQIAETAAFILGKDCESRIHTERRVKELYSRRSAYVHAGSRHVERQDLYDAIDLARGITHAFLVSSPYATMQKSAEIPAYIQELRYQ